MAQNQICKQLSPYNFLKIERTTRTGNAFQRIKEVKGVKLKSKWVAWKYPRIIVQMNNIAEDEDVQMLVNGKELK